MGRFRKQKARLGSVALTLFLAGWLNLLVQPCLTAAPLDVHHDSSAQHQSEWLSGSAAYALDGSLDDLAAMVDCESMEGCGDWDGSYTVVPSLELETKFLAVVVSSAQVQPDPVPVYPPSISRPAPFLRVPLFIRNCSFLI